MSKIFFCLSSKIISKDILDNKEYLEKRQKELEDIKKVTSQIREISNDMGMKIKDQAILIGNIYNFIYRGFGKKYIYCKGKC